MWHPEVNEELAIILSIFFKQHYNAPTTLRCIFSWCTKWSFENFYLFLLSMHMLIPFDAFCNTSCYKLGKKSWVSVSGSAITSIFNWVAALWHEEKQHGVKGALGHSAMIENWQHVEVGKTWTQVHQNAVPTRWPLGHCLSLACSNIEALFSPSHPIPTNLWKGW